MQTLDQLNCKVGDRIKTVTSNTEYSISKIEYTEKSKKRYKSTKNKNVLVVEIYFLVGDSDNVIAYKNLTQAIWTKVNLQE